MKTGEFSHRTRSESLARFGREKFDLLVVGGGITGAAVARDAASRGLKVALVEKRDFAWGTSSRSSKLIHGGLRYLENLEFGLVFEALAERAFLLKTAPHMVRPLAFYLPVYQGDPKGRMVLSMGLWLYDLLSLFRAPDYHRRLSRRKMLEAIPGLKPDGLKGGFRYYDASMWDDMLAVETLRSATQLNAAIANYTEAMEPLRDEGMIRGFRVRDLERPGGAPIEIRAERTVVCAGPWTDELGARMDPGWKAWLSPSQGVHLVFDLKRLPLPGAMVMLHPKDGRISFVIPRPDLGAGVTIVGTTDGPVSGTADRPGIQPADVEYLMALLHRYFPERGLTTRDIVSAYIGIRPLVKGGEGQSLQKVSREHSIERGPGGVTLVGGGKYTTHRKMAEEIVDFALAEWRKDARAGVSAPPPEDILIGPRTDLPVNPRTLHAAVDEARGEAIRRGITLPPRLVELYGAGALEIVQAQEAIRRQGLRLSGDPDGFPMLAGQLLYLMRRGGVLHLEDFYFRRAPLFLSRADHGEPWIDELAAVWASERGVGEAEAREEAARLRNEIGLRCQWQEADPSGT